MKLDKIGTNCTKERLINELRYLMRDQGSSGSDFTQYYIGHVLVRDLRYTQIFHTPTNSTHL